MINQLLTELGEITEGLTAVFLFPGEMLLSLVDRIAPEIVAILTFGNGALVVPFVIALLVWTSIAILGLQLLRFCRNVARQFSAWLLTFWHRARLALQTLTMRIMWRLRAWFPRRESSAEIIETPTIEFDDLDMAVLRTVSAQGPGFALSAPELAEKFTMRPARLQKSLEKLSKNKMLDSVIGSTDGFDNYRMTVSGLAYMAMLQRQQARQ